MRVKTGHRITTIVFTVVIAIGLLGIPTVVLAYCVMTYNPSLREINQILGTSASNKEAALEQYMQEHLSQALSETEVDELFKEIAFKVKFSVFEDHEERNYIVSNSVFDSIEIRCKFKDNRLFSVCMVTAILIESQWYNYKFTEDGTLVLDVVY